MLLVIAFRDHPCVRIDGTFHVCLCSRTVNSGLNFDSESDQATDFKLNIHSSVGRVSRQVQLLRRWEKRVNESLSPRSGRRMAVTPPVYDSASIAFSCQENKNVKK